MAWRRLTLVFPPALEDAVTATLLEREPAAGGFTLLRVEGHGADFSRASVREQVRGHVARRMLWVVLPEDAVEGVLEDMRHCVPPGQVVWWTEAVDGFGRLA